MSMLLLSGLVVLISSADYAYAAAVAPEEINANLTTDQLFWQQLYQSIKPEFKSANQSNVTLAFHYDETIAVIQYNEEKVERCRLIEVNTRLKQKIAIEELSTTIPVFPMEMHTMIYLISSCQKFHPGESKPRPRGRSTQPETSPLPWSFLTTIVPGTKWCGPGDNADSYDDLGPLVEMDKCCRAHDHCPLKVKGMRTAHGLLNLSFYTKSHCACDDEFFACLKSVEKPMSRMLGNLYFNVLQVPCLEEDDKKFEIATDAKLEILPEICKRRSDETCPYHLKSSFGVKRYKFVNVHRRF